MPTSRLGLPTITGNMTNDMVRDLNALAEAVDEKVAPKNATDNLATKDELTNHVGESASTTKKGHVQLSSATNSISEVLAATPKAVKEAYDLANGKANANHPHVIDNVAGLQSVLDSKIPLTQKNAVNGIAGLDGNGKLAESLMPTNVGKIVSGTYAGDGNTSRFIDVGFPVKFLSIGRTGSFTETYIATLGVERNVIINGSGSVAWNGYIQGNGFFVGSGNYPNQSIGTYTYVVMG